MAHQIIWSPRAASNLDDICSYIARDSEYYAALFARKIIALIKSISAAPKAGRGVPEYRDERLRERIYKGYRIVYRIRGEKIEIAAICHGAKLLDDNL